LLEGACAELDLKLAASCSDLGDEAENSFDRYSTALHQMSQLQSRLSDEQETAKFLDQLVTFFSVTLPDASMNSSLEKVRSQASKTWHSVNQTVSMNQR